MGGRLEPTEEGHHAETDGAASCAMLRNKQPAQWRLLVHAPSEVRSRLSCLPDNLCTIDECTGDARSFLTSSLVAVVLVRLGMRWRRFWA